MSDLISRKAFKKQLSVMEIKENLNIEKISAMLKLIDSQPIAYDVDKVAEKLKESDFYIDQEKCITVEDAVAIVKVGLEE